MASRRLARAALLLSIASAASTGCLHLSPGTLYESSSAPLTAQQSRLRDELRRDVEELCDDIGPRNAAESISKIQSAERWLLDRLEESDIEAERDEIDLNGPKAANVVVTFAGTERPDQILLLGAHYDTVYGSPGANDNASGVALLLATARRLRDEPTAKTVRIVFFANEESPFSGGWQMGSRVHAERSRRRGDDIFLMVAVDSVGYYTSAAGSQDYPWLIRTFAGLPSTGNFVALVSNRENRELLDRVVAVFQTESRFPSIGIATDMKAVARSDHASFWWENYPALALTDTSETRDPNYHRPTDTADQLDYDELARMAEGFMRTVRVLANVTPPLPSHRAASAGTP